MVGDGGAKEGVGFLTMINFVHFEYLIYQRSGTTTLGSREWRALSNTHTHSLALTHAHARTMIYSRLRPPLIYYPFNGAENKNRSLSTPGSCPRDRYIYSWFRAKTIRAFLCVCVYAYSTFMLLARILYVKKKYSIIMIIKIK